MEAPSNRSEKKDDDLPQAGWYADPSGEGGLRWWTGEMWAQKPDLEAFARERLRPPGDWFADSLQASKRVASNLFALIGILILPPFFALAASVWHGFQEYELLLRINQESGAASLIEIRGGARLADSILTIVLSLVAVWFGSIILIFASSIQVVQASMLRPASWLQSLQPLLVRKQQVGGVLFIFAILTAWLGYSLSGQPPAGLTIVLLPLLAVASIILVLKFSFAPTAAVLGDPEISPMRQSIETVKGRTGEVFQRLFFLLTWFFVGSFGFIIVMRLILGGAAEDPALAGTSDRYLYRFTGVFGDNVYLWLLMTVFAGLFWGLVISIWSGANALLFKELGGSVHVSNHPLVESDLEQHSDS